MANETIVWFPPVGVHIVCAAVHYGTSRRIAVQEPIVVIIPISKHQYSLYEKEFLNGDTHYAYDKRMIIYTVNLFIKTNQRNRNKGHNSNVLCP